VLGYASIDELTCLCWLTIKMKNFIGEKQDEKNVIFGNRFGDGFHPRCL
jgi:hypothetical protein